MYTDIMLFVYIFYRNGQDIELILESAIQPIFLQKSQFLRSFLQLGTKQKNIYAPGLFVPRHGMLLKLLIFNV